MPGGWQPWLARVEAVINKVAPSCSLQELAAWRLVAVASQG